MKLKQIVASLSLLLALPVMAESTSVPVMAGSMSDIINERINERNREADKTKLQVIIDPSVVSRKKSPPRLVGLRGIDENLVATFESESGAFETSMKSTDLPDGWKLISIGHGRAKISHGKDKPITVFLTGRVGNATSPQDIFPPPPPPPF